MTHVTSLTETLRLLPKLAITGIGSLPHTQHELGLQMALQVDVPYLPQMPTGLPGELMIPQAVEGLPGASFDSDGVCTIDVRVWERGRSVFTQALEAALSAQTSTAFDPTVESCAAWFPFLFEVEQRKLAFAKIQLAGPATVRWVVRTSGGEPAAEVAQLDQDIYRLILARSLAMVRAIRRRGSTPVFFLDEPGLYALDLNSPRHLLVLQELRLLAVALQREGALVGLHCCSNTHWAAILGLGLNVLSLDVRLSLDALLENRRAFREYLDGGGTLALGLIPTNAGAEYELNALVESVEASLRASVPAPRFQETLARMLLTPACGLAMRSVSDAERVFEELRVAQGKLKRLVSEPAQVSPVARD
ncbi:MAG: hypothetical protein ACKVPX_06360 [Myxococcaceae bacterium]